MVLTTLAVLGGLIWVTVVLCIEIRIYSSESKIAINKLAKIMNPCVHPLDMVPVEMLDEEYDGVVRRVLAVEAN